MHQAGGVIPMVAGLVAVVLNRRMDDASVRSARRPFGREPGRSMHAFGRVMAVVVGTLMFLGGGARLLGLW